MSRIASFRLLAGLRVVRPWTLVLLVVLQVLRAAVTPVAAAATGLVVAQAGGGLSGALVVALIVFLLALWLGESVGHALWLIRANVARVVDGSLRSEIRLLLGRASSMELVEDPQLRDDVAHVMSTGGARGYEQSLGTAAGSQLGRWFDVIEMVGIAAVLVPVSPWYALSAVVLVLVLRRVMQATQQCEADGEADDARGLRRTAYWTRLGTDAAAAKEIRIFGMGDWVARRRRSEAESYLLPRWQRHVELLRREAGVGLAIAAAGVWVIGVPVWFAATGRIDAAGLARALVAAIGLMFLVARVGIGWNIAYGHVVLAALGRVRERLGRDASGAGAARPTTADARAAVTLRGIGFAYGDGPAVLDGLDLRIAAGEVLAVVGPNGAGKTTLMKLLAGLDTPTAGVVDGPPRERVTVLFSDFVRYPLSVRDNVTLAAPEVDPDPDEVDRCLELAGAQDLAGRWPNGLDTPLSALFEGGVDLSGGQWQKVALARAIFGARHGRSLLIMDEPTAHLDAGQEAEFYDRVVRTLHGVTIVLVSHRLSTVRSADRIVLIEAGRIREQGSHPELITAGGEYARMFALQASRFATRESSDASDLDASDLDASDLDASDLDASDLDASDLDPTPEVAR